MSHSYGPCLTYLLVSYWKSTVCLALSNYSSFSQAGCECLQWRGGSPVAGWAVREPIMMLRATQSHSEPYLLHLWLILFVSVSLKQDNVSITWCYHTCGLLLLLLIDQMIGREWPVGLLINPVFWIMVLTVTMLLVFIPCFCVSQRVLCCGAAWRIPGWALC